MTNLGLEFILKFYTLITIVSFALGVVKLFRSKPNTAKREWAKTLIYLGLICFPMGISCYFLFI